MSGRTGALVEWGYAAGWAVIRALPRSAAWAIFRVGADRAARKRGPGAQRLERNLRRIVGAGVAPAEMDRLVREGLRSYARYWLEAFRLPTLNRRQILAGFRFEREHLLGEALAGGRGCVIAISHSGNWDYAGAYVCAKGWPVTTVAERLKPEGLYQRFVEYRAKLGIEIIPTVGGDRPPMEILTERLEEPRIVPLLADRDLSARGVEVEFFGGRTRMPAGPAMLALRTGVPLFVVSLFYDGDTPCGYVHDQLALPPASLGPLDVRVKALTQSIADVLAEGIAAHPTDWHMLQRLWLDDLPAQPADRTKPAASDHQPA